MFNQHLAGYWRSIWQDLCEQVLPSCCPQCNTAPGPDLCTDCASTWTAIANPCPHCGESDSIINCQRCRGKGLRYISSIHAAFHYHGGVRQMIRQAKASGDYLAMRALARLWTPPKAMFAEHFRKLDSQRPLYWITIPSSSSNPNKPHLASVLGNIWHQALGVDQRSWLKWQRRVAVQHHLSAQQRQHNLKQAFQANSACRDAQILLFDDILTSGATLVAAAGALRTAGAHSIHAFCFARTPTPAAVRQLTPLRSSPTP